MYKLDPVTLAPKNNNNRETHIYYLEHTMKQAAILREIVKQDKSLNPLDSASYFTCKYVKLIQELLGYVRDTCPDIHKPSKKLVVVMPINKKIIVRHELCFLKFVSHMNASSKSKSVKKAKKKEEWKPTRKMFTKIGYNWRPTGRTFTLVGNACPLTRIIATNKVPIKEPIPLEVVVQIVLWYLDSGCSKHMTKDCSQLTNFIHKFLSTVKFGVDLLSRSRKTNHYTLSIGDMMASSPICLLSKASKTKSWLLHRRLSHLNFGTINYLAKNGLVRGLPKLKFEKDHLCSAYAMVKFLASKVEAPDFTIKSLKMIQVRLNMSVRNIRTDNGTEKPDLSYLHVFGALCYPNNDSEDLGKLQAKADIGIFIGYAPKKKAYRIYNRHTQKVIETIHVDFDELTTLASEQRGSGHGLQSMTHATSNSRLVTNPIPQQPCNPPPRDDWDRLFQPMFDEYFNPLTIAVSLVPVANAPRSVDLADLLVSTSIDQDAPSTSIPSTQDQGHSLIISQENVIGDPSRSVSTRKQLQTDAIWCYFDAFLTSVEPNIFKQAMTEPSWIGAIMSLTAYADADHVVCQDTRHSTSESAQFLGDKFVSWSFKKQRALRSRRDNKNAIALYCNKVQHLREKHIDVRYHFIKEQVENEIVKLYFVQTEYQLADIFTKPLPRERFNFFIEKLGMRNMSPKKQKRLTEEEDE
uniref:Retrovirus-related Pol polyprotein from transposon TNT 1-94 n=1 Tax=Tanacetum cinerariifolium TaxID=118510 RepID=A0A699HMG7_TANCI|nr:retrovirus-related Pol polyprotein from transposon TNT 1-94 [Tanacetum cinerariifolium]